MVFDLTPTQQAARDRARAVAEETLAPIAASIDESGAIPADVLRELHAALSELDDDAIGLVVSVEELARASAAAAAAAWVKASGGAPAGAPGLRGFAPPRTADTRMRLVAAAVAIGIGRAAIDRALQALRESARGGHDQDKPHWVVADAATEVDAARLVTLQAAQTMESGADADGAVAMAKLAATRAAQQAVDAALRVVGAEGFARGTVLERLSRDARAVSLLLGTEEELRGIAANAVLPG